MKNRINLKSFIKVILDQLRSLFFNGLLMLLPVTITFYLFKFLFHIMQSWLSPLRDLEPEYLQAIPYLEFALAVTLILILGLISRNIIFKQIINHLEKAIGKIPLIKPIYRGSKQLVHAFTHHDKDSFQQIVYIEFHVKVFIQLDLLQVNSKNHSHQINQKNIIMFLSQHHQTQQRDIMF